MWPYWFTSHFQLVFAIAFLKVLYLLHLAYYVYRSIISSLSWWWSEVWNHIGSMFKDCQLGPGRGIIQALQTYLSPGAPLLMLTKAAHEESLLGHGAMLWSPGRCVVLENRLQAWQQLVDGVPGRWWRHTNWARGHSWGRSRRRIYLVDDILRNTTSNSQLIQGDWSRRKFVFKHIASGFL